MWIADTAVRSAKKGKRPSPRDAPAAHARPILSAHPLPQANAKSHTTTERKACTGRRPSAWPVQYQTHEAALNHDAPAVHAHPVLGAQPLPQADAAAAAAAAGFGQRRAAAAAIQRAAPAAAAAACSPGTLGELTIVEVLLMVGNRAFHDRSRWAVELRDSFTDASPQAGGFAQGNERQSRKVKSKCQKINGAIGFCPIPHITHLAGCRRCQRYPQCCCHRWCWRPSRRGRHRTPWSPATRAINRFRYSSQRAWHCVTV